MKRKVFSLVTILLAPLVIADLVFACTSNGQDDRHNKVPAPLAPTLVVLDKKTGRLVADGKVYLSTESNILWTLKAGRKLEVLSKTRLQSTPITPVAADGVLYLPEQRSLLAVPGK